VKKIGIICEYNPFHSGHAYQIAKIRERDADAAIVCLMSGHATQRGELAIADKYTRAAMALSGGADIILELPYPYSSASAPYFAGAGVAILDALGVDELSFGSETADLTLLEKTAEIMEKEQFYTDVSTRQRAGEGSAQAYFSELQQHLPDTEIHLLSNDILAVEYIRAIRALKSSMRPMPIFREGSAYRAQSLENGKNPSATALRKKLINGDVNESLKYVPKYSAEVLKKAIKSDLAPIQTDFLDAAILCFFRLTPSEGLAMIAEMQGGLAYRLCAAARESISYADMLAKASSKSYPTARLRRAVLFAMTGVRESDLRTAPVYLSLLGANERGRKLLRVWKEAAPFPISAKFADAAAVSPAATRQAELTLALDSIFTLAHPTPCSADYWIKKHPILL